MMLAEEVDQPATGPLFAKENGTIGTINRDENKVKQFATNQRFQQRSGQVHPPAWTDDALTVYLQGLPVQPRKSVTLLVQNKLFFESRPANGTETTSAVVALPPFGPESTRLEVELQVPSYNAHQHLRVDINSGAHLLISWNADNRSLQVSQHHTEPPL